MNEYKNYSLGKKNKINMYILKQPIEKGVLGLIKSNIFTSDIGIHVTTESDETEDLVLGSFYISSYNQQPMISISPLISSHEKKTTI